VSLILDLDPSTERKLKAAASRTGTSSQEFAIGALKDRLSLRRSSSSSKPVSIPALLQEINRGLTEGEWRRYKKLIAKRRKKTLTRAELTELCETSDWLEEVGARRIKLITELARLRGTDFDTEFRKLGIAPKNV